MTAPQLARNCCTIGTKEIKLQPLETELLACLLLSHPDYFVGIADLAIAMWKADGGPLRPELTIKVLVQRLRTAGVEIEAAHTRGAAKRQGYSLKGYRIPAERRGARIRWIDRIVIPRRPRFKPRKIDRLFAAPRRSIGADLTLFR